MIFRIAFMLNCSVLVAQNLVSNPSFEDNIGCPGPDIFLKNTKNWFSLENHSGTPDLFWKDCGYNGIGSHNSMAHDQLPKDGLAFIGMFTCGDGLREYCYTELKEPMIAGENYKVSYWISPAAGYGTAINSFGAHFSTAPVHGKGDLKYLPLVEHIGFPNDHLLSDTNVWTLVEGNYTALGGERYLTFGNFRSDNETQKQVIQTNCIRSDRSYILLDLVSVVHSSPNPPVLLSEMKENQRITRSVFYAKSNAIQIQLWDHNRVDGDSITLLLNGSVLEQNIPINKQVKSFNITLNEQVNYIEIQALNLGLITPNTVALRVSDGHSEKKIILSSTLTVSEAIKLVVDL